MNNNYYGFNPNLMRNASLTNMANMAPRTGLLSSLFGTRGAATAVGSASKVTFSGILNGASKTLGVINQAIPVFYQVKPIFNNAKTIFKVAKEIKSNDNTENIVRVKENYENAEKNKESFGPTFFD